MHRELQKETIQHVLF